MANLQITSSELASEINYDFTVNKNTDVDILISQLKRWGIVHIPNFLDADELNQVCQEFDALLALSESWASAGNGKFDKSVKVERFRLSDDQFPNIVRIFGSAYMETICKQYLGDPSIFNQFILAKHNFYDKRGDRINDPHFDTIRSLKFFLYLDDTDVNNGAFEYAPGTHSMNRQQAIEFYAKGGKVRDTPNVALPHEAEQLIPIVGTAGTLLVFDTDGFHGGGYVHKGCERRVIRSHCYESPKLAIYPERFSKQWFRESWLNPHRYMGKASIPNRPATGGKGRKQVLSLQQKMRNILDKVRLS